MASSDSTIRPPTAGKRPMAEITATEAPAKTRGYRFWFKNKGSTKRKICKELDGSKGYNGSQWYRRPTKVIDDVENDAEADKQLSPLSYSRDKYAYRNQYGQLYEKKRDVETYLSPTQFIPRRLIVQASSDVWTSKEPFHENWRRTKMRGQIPAVLKLAEWALGPTNVRPNEDGTYSDIPWYNWLNQAWRTLVVAVPLQILLASKLVADPRDEDEVEEGYKDWPGYHWSWPKYAVNPLDMQPGTEQTTEALAENYYSWKTRLVLPRQLMVLEHGQWTMKSFEGYDGQEKPYQYVFVSYTNKHWRTGEWAEGYMDRRAQLERIAEKLAVDGGCDAYWMDFKCRAQENGPLLDSDVNRFCDVIRGAKKVVIALPGEELNELKVWGDRMWTLPEGLLPTGNIIHIYDAKTSIVSSKSKVQMTADVWFDRAASPRDIQGTRLLAEHFTGSLTLSRLELFSVALGALAKRGAMEDTDGRPELAYALMGFLNQRLDPMKDETVFQGIARLSLLNDSDRLIERMVCMLPDWSNMPEWARSNPDPFLSLAQTDKFNTQLHSILPTCEVVGVGQDDYTVMLDGCRAIPIRWKSFPRMHFKKSFGLKKLFASLFIASGAWFFLTGLALLWTYAPFIVALAEYSAQNSADQTERHLKNTVFKYFAVFVSIVGGLAVLASALGPISVRRLYGGSVMESSPHLVGFEGTMPISKLEKLVFGNDNNRLGYEPSSTPFCRYNRNKTLREGTEPAWVKDQSQPVNPPVSPGHRLFTLVDTGNLTVSIFEAVAPPTVALICGREGGMLRAVLCSWDFVDDCLHRQSVIRMSSAIYDRATEKSWLKLSLRNPLEKAP